MRTRTLLPLLILLILLTTLAAMDKTPPTYPPSRKDNTVDLVHGTPVHDPYRWLEDGKSKEVQQWVEKQNALTRDYLDKVPDRSKIHDRLGQLLEIGSIGAPVPVKGRYFYTRRDGVQNQSVLCVREGLAGPDRVLIDPNTLAEDGTIAIDWWYPSRDGKFLTYGLSSGGDEQSTLHLLEVETGKKRPDVIERTRACSVTWAPDSSGFYYTRYPKPGSVPKGEENYHRQVYYHALGDDPAKDIHVFGQGRPAEDWPDVRLSPDGRWLVVTEHQGWAKTEVFFSDLSKPGTGFTPLIEKSDAIYNVVVRNDRFYVLTNEKAPRYRFFVVDPLKAGRGDWSEIVAESKEVLESATVIGDTVVGLYLHNAASRLQLFDKTGTPLVDVKLPTLGSIAGLGAEWDGEELFFGFQSFTVAPSIYRLDLKTRASELWQRVRTDIDPGNYDIGQVVVTSRDKTRITMFLAHKKGLEIDGQTPTLLYGYGGFNISLTPAFNASRFLFLEKGGILAIANLRGGGEYGEEWHQDGMLGKKQNVFDDFLAAAQWLIDEKYTDREHLAIQGGSNGGLLMGAALTQKPDLFRAVVCQVPLLDMVRYHKFLIARLWIPEYGSADEPEQFRWLHAYSPYHRVTPETAYPAVLLATAEGDSRVDALHARKMAAQLQAATTSGRPILLRLETKAGHGAGKPRVKVLEELTDLWSFLFAQLGMKM